MSVLLISGSRQPENQSLLLVCKCYEQMCSGHEVPPSTTRGSRHATSKKDTKKSCELRGCFEWKCARALTLAAFCDCSSSALPALRPRAPPQVFRGRAESPLRLRKVLCAGRRSPFHFPSLEGQRSSGPVRM